MKRKLLLFALIATALTFTSCSSDDDDSSSEERLIGKWQLIEETVDGELLPLDCNHLGLLYINDDNTLDREVYVENIDGVCAIFGAADQGTWENTGNSNYTIIVEGVTMTGEIEFVNATFEFTFEEGGIIYTELYLRK